MLMVLPIMLFDMNIQSTQCFYSLNFNVRGFWGSFSFFFTGENALQDKGHSRMGQVHIYMKCSAVHPGAFLVNKTYVHLSLKYNSLHMIQPSANK